MYQNYKTHWTQILSTNLQNGGQKFPESRPKLSKLVAQVAPGRSQDDQKIKNNIGPEAIIRSSHFEGKCGQDGSKLPPQIEAKSKKNHPKIDQKIDASWDQFLEGFWWTLGSKMEPSWHQNPSKIGISCEKAFFEKTLSFFKKNNDFEGSGGPSWE